MNDTTKPSPSVITDHPLSVLDVPGPTPTGESMPFWEAAREGQLKIPHCNTCGKFFFYPRHLCPHCWSRDWAWQQASGWSTLKTYTIVHRAGHPSWAAVAPYAVGLVELDEGPVLMTHVLATPAPCRVGSLMDVQFVKLGDWVLPCFAPSDRTHDEETKNG